MPFTSEQLLEIRNRFHYADVCPIQGPRAFFENAGGSLTLKALDRTLRRAAADGGDDDESALPRPPTVQTGRLATRRRSL